MSGLMFPVKTDGFKCKVCGEVFKSIDKMVTHMYEEHGWGPDNPNPAP